MCYVRHFIKDKTVCQLKINKINRWIDLQIADPDVYIRAHVDADRQRHKTCSSYVFTIPVALPQTICIIIPVNIT